ncbi:MAG: NAD-dependent epimerase/dehydratase family protein, partial [Chitinophagaceae bacterium]
MKILITGANGYIGKRIIEPLLKAGHEVYCAVRNKGRFHFETKNEKLHVIEVDLEDPAKLQFPEEIEIAYYLVHSMRQGKDFE